MDNEWGLDELEDWCESAHLAARAACCLAKRANMLSDQAADEGGPASARMLEKIAERLEIVKDLAQKVYIEAISPQECNIIRRNVIGVEP